MCKFNVILNNLPALNSIGLVQRIMNIKIIFFDFLFKTSSLPCVAENIRFCDYKTKKPYRIELFFEF